MHNPPEFPATRLLVLLGLMLLGVVLLMCATAPDLAPDQKACPDGFDCPLVVEELLHARSGESNLPRGAATGVVLDLPPELRTKNWGGGSCVHASNCNQLLQMDMPELAAWWRKTYRGGEYDTRLIQRLEAAGLRYAYVHDRQGQDSDGDGKSDGEEYFDWCTRTRRGAGIFFKPSHSINFVGMDDEWVYLLDNNATSYPEAKGHYERVARSAFFRQWRGYGGFAWTIIGQPVPHTPHVELEL